MSWSEGWREAGSSMGRGRESDPTAIEGGKSSQRIPHHPLLPPAGVSGAGDPVPQPSAPLQPVPPQVHAGGWTGSRGGERPGVSFAVHALLCPVCPAAASTLPLVLAQSAFRSTRRQRSHSLILWEAPSKRGLNAGTNC